MTTRYTEPLTMLPDVPKEFGGDGGYFIRHYDQLADETNDDLAKKLKAQCDGILLFGGLFAGINSAFLVLTLPKLEADQADLNNKILVQILLGHNCTTAPGCMEEITVNPRPDPNMVQINALFSMSLILAMLASLLAILGQQWVVAYRKRGGGGPEDQRWEQLRRSLGAQRWRLELVLGDFLPYLLQLGLVLFECGFIWYLWTLGVPWIASFAAVITAGLAVLCGLAASAVWDPWCPFKVSFSIVTLPIVVVLVCLWIGDWLGLVVLLFIIGSMVVTVMDTRLRRSLQVLFRPAMGLWLFHKLMGPVNQSNDTEYLKSEAVRRMVGIYEDRTALVHTAMNLQTIKKHGPLSSLFRDEVFHSRLIRLWRTAVDQVRSLKETDNSPLSIQARIEARAFSTSLSHLWLSTGSFIEGKATSSPIGTCTDIQSLAEGALITFTPAAACDQCSHCTTLRFSMKFASLVAADLNPRSPPSPNVYKEVEGALASSVDLRLGCVVASTILISEKLSNAPLIGAPPEQINSWRSDAFKELFTGYRAEDKSQMLKRIHSGLDTVEEKWKGQPDHELYVRLFELGLSTEMDVADKARGSDHLGILISTSACPILDRLGVLLLSIEERIRDEAASETDRERGREQQDRCIQSVIDNLEEHSRLKSEVWLHASRSLVPYLTEVKRYLETDTANPKNLSTIDILRRIKSLFSEPEAGSGSTAHTPDTTNSSFRQLLDQTERAFQTRDNGTSEGTVAQPTGASSTIQ